MRRQVDVAEFGYELRRAKALLAAHRDADVARNLLPMWNSLNG
jgi:hypothetical protein